MTEIVNKPVGEIGKPVADVPTGPRGPRGGTLRDRSSDQMGVPELPPIAPGQLYRVDLQNPSVITVVGDPQGEARSRRRPPVEGANGQEPQDLAAAEDREKRLADALVRDAFPVEEPSPSRRWKAAKMAREIIRPGGLAASDIPPEGRAGLVAEAQGPRPVLEPDLQPIDVAELVRSTLAYGRPAVASRSRMEEPARLGVSVASAEVGESGEPTVTLLTRVQVHNRYGISPEALAELEDDGVISFVSGKKGAGYPEAFFDKNGVVPGVGDIMAYHTEVGTDDDQGATPAEDVVKALITPVDVLEGRTIRDELIALRGKPSEEVTARVDELAEISEDVLRSLASK